MLNNKIQQIINKSLQPKLLEGVFKFARAAYKEKERVSGENYIEHAVNVASILNEMNLAPTTIAAGILHDAVDELPSSVKKAELVEIEKKFGKEVAFLVERVADLYKIRYPLTTVFEETKFTKEKIENLRKMFLALAQDLRVVLIELVSRMDNLNYLNYLPPDEQKLYALETLKIFVPIAERLGLGEIKTKLEDLSFSYLLPAKFQWVKEHVREKYEERKKYLKAFTPHLKKVLKKERVNFLDINSRPKSYWSTYQKLLRYNMDFEKIYDLVALRIIVNSVESCYKVLGVIHKYWKPLYEEIDDFIAKPKPNGYRSLHTTIFCEKGHISEIQIRTPQMQKEAEHGVCAHWAYKEKIDLRKEGEKFEWAKSLPEFWKTYKIEVFSNQIFVFTPKGDVINLPKDATPIDFAYSVHSEIGDYCEFAKVNGKIVALSQPLRSGDIVQILVNKKRTPSPDWLNFVKTNLAAAHIKKALTKTELVSKISLLGKKTFSLPRLIKKKAVEISEKIKKKGVTRIKRKKVREIYIAGQKGILANLAKCCNPQPGDDVKAYITKYRAAVLHKTSCKNFQRLAKKFPNKVVKAHWE